MYYDPSGHSIKSWFENLCKKVAEFIGDDTPAGEVVNEGGSNFRNQKLLDTHYDKHVNEFGNISKEEYLKRAGDFVNSRSEDILTKIRTNGDIIFYNPNSNEFAVKSVDGYIRTYFKPSDGMDYFDRQ